MSTARPGGPLRVALDTNVYFSAFMGAGGAPYELWRRAVAREYAIVVSPPIVNELAEVLRLRLEWPEVEIIAQLKLLIRVATIVQPKIPLQVVLADPDDDRILECALAGNAHLIVSGDHHILRLKVFQNIGIVRPADFLRTLR
jgi:putative PIN family toxin of toxin-antitoxin system